MYSFLFSTISNVTKLFLLGSYFSAAGEIQAFWLGSCQDSFFQEHLKENSVLVSEEQMGLVKLFCFFFNLHCLCVGMVGENGNLIKYHTYSRKP